MYISLHTLVIHDYIVFSRLFQLYYLHSAWPGDRDDLLEAKVRSITIIISIIINITIMIVSITTIIVMFIITSIIIICISISIIIISMARAPSEASRNFRIRRGGGWYGWKPSPSSDFSTRAFRIQIVQFELFEFILLLKLDKQLPVE